MKVVDGIAIWGDHDESTIGQIKRCAADERAAGAALLATGAVGAVWSTWFGLLLCVGALPAVADVVETRRLRRVHRRSGAAAREGRPSAST